MIILTIIMLHLSRKVLDKLISYSQSDVTKWHLIMLALSDKIDLFFSVCVSFTPFLVVDGSNKEWSLTQEMRV